MSLSVLTILLIAGYLLAQAALLRSRLQATLIVFGLIPAVLSPYWLIFNNYDLFLLVKFYSLMICNCWIVCLRFLPIGKNRFAQASIPVLLAINIVEAVIVDAVSLNVVGGLNAVAGMILILLVPYGWKSIRIDEHTGFQDMKLDLGISWIVGYTIWNWAFLTHNYPEYAGVNVAVLVAPLIVGLVEPSRWLQARALTLGLYLIFTATNMKWSRELVDLTPWIDSNFQFCFAAAACGWMGAVLVSELTKTSSSIVVNVSQPNASRCTSNRCKSKRCHPWIAVAEIANATVLNSNSRPFCCGGH